MQRTAICAWGSNCWWRALRLVCREAGCGKHLLARGSDLALLPDGLVHSLVRALILTLTESRGGQFETRVAQTLHLLPDSFVDQLLPLH